MQSLLNLAATWPAVIDELTLGNKDAGTLLSSVFNIISIVLWVALAIVGAVGAIYAIWCGIQLARAEDTSKRDEAKKHLITVCIAVGVTLALILVFNLFLPMVVSAIHGASVNAGDPNPSQS